MAWEMTLQNTFLDFVNFTLTASWVILAVLILRAVLTRVPKKYVCLLWFVVLFRLLCPVTIETVLSVVPQPSTITYEDVAYTTPKIETGSAVVNTIADYTVNPVMEAYLAPTPQSSVNPMQVYLFIASILWVAGIVAIGIYTIISWVKMALRLRESVPEAGYYRCANIQSPFVFGLLKPKIYIPYGLDGEAKEYVLLHEQSHIARKDFLVKPIFWLAVMVHWMNPMVWIAWHYFSRDLELACDERAIDALDKNQKSDYSNTLLSLAVQPKYFSCPVAFGNNSVKERITHVLHYKGIPALARDTICILMVLAAVLLVVNPLKAGPLSDFKPKLLEEYPYGLNSVNIQYGAVRASVNDSKESAINSPKAEAVREWLADIEVQKVRTENASSLTNSGVSITVSGVTDYSYDEENLQRSVMIEPTFLSVSNDFQYVYVDGLSEQNDTILKVKQPDLLRDWVLSCCEDALQSYPETTFYADLSHDGKDEIILINPGQQWDTQGQANIAVYLQDGTLLYSTYLNTAHAGWGNYFLYEKDGKDYLMQFQPTMYQGYADYFWKLYEFDDKNQMVTVEENKADFSINPEQYDFNIVPILNFLTEVETMLNDATLLVSVEGGNLLHSTAAEPKQVSLNYYLDWLNPTWNDEQNNVSLEEKLVNYQNSIYFDGPRQALVQWLVDNKGMDLTQQHLESSGLIEIDGVQCAKFDLHWNADTPALGALIDRYAISTNNPDNFDAVGNSRNYYLLTLRGEWVYLENSADILDGVTLANQWAETYADRDGQARYDMMTSDLQQKIDALDEYESLGEDWMPYWTEDKKSLGLGGSSPWAENWEVMTYGVADDSGGHYFARITYDMMDSAQGSYVYEETIEFNKEHGAWKVSDCYVSINLLSKATYGYVQNILTSLDASLYEYFDDGSKILAELQEGPELWRLEPLEAAAKFVEDYLEITEGYWMEFDESKNIVLCHTNEQDYTIYLYKPIQRGEPTDFYAVAAYEYYENGEEKLRSYHVGNNPWASLHIANPE